MKLIIIIYLLLNGFCEGYDDGYVEGWCYQVQNCLEPIPPICPLPVLEEDINSYRDGYNRGFKEGLEDRNESN